METNYKHKIKSIGQCICKFGEDNVMGYRVVSSPFDMVLIPRDKRTLVLAKLVCSGEDRFYLSKIKNDINSLLRVFNRNKIPCVLVIKFYGNKPEKASWSVIKIKRQMPAYIDRNLRNEIDYIE